MHPGSSSLWLAVTFDCLPFRWFFSLSCSTNMCGQHEKHKLALCRVEVPDLEPMYKFLHLQVYVIDYPAEKM